MNRVILLGNITTEPEVKTSGETKIVRILIAVGRTKDKADFFKCIAFSRTAEYIEKYADKGTKLVIEGRLASSKYDDKNGVTQYPVEVYIENVTILKGWKNNQQEDMPF